jgi:hypothetical protein
MHLYGANREGSMDDVVCVARHPFIAVALTRFLKESIPPMPDASRVVVSDRRHASTVVLCVRLLCTLAWSRDFTPPRFLSSTKLVS